MEEKKNNKSSVVVIIVSIFLILLATIVVILVNIGIRTKSVVSDVMDDTRNRFMEEETWSVISAIQYSYVNGQIESNTVIDITKVIKENNEKVHITGNKPTSGTFTIDENGKVFIKDMTFDGYKCNYKKIGTDDAAAASSSEADYTSIICTK